MENYPIDFIITWVDGNDDKWRKDKEKYSEKKGDTRNSRYRDWDTLRYLLRSIEDNAPWVNKVYLVTYGHLPSWINLNCSKLVIINHKDYIPPEFLPTFSSRTIDMNFHRIDSLADHFVYFNDDMILLDKVQPEDFFKNGLPCDTAVLRPSIVKIKNETTSQMYLAPIIDMALINKYFRKRDVIRKNFFKWYSPIYGKELLKTLSMVVWGFFPGIREYHCCYSYLKRTYEEVWKKENRVLTEVCTHKFRTNTDYNHWIFSYWQMAKGEFVPRSPKFGFAYALSDDDKYNKSIYQALLNRKFRMVCLNDNVSDSNFERVCSETIEVLQSLYSKKSMFEK